MPILIRITCSVHFNCLKINLLDDDCIETEHAIGYLDFIMIIYILIEDLQYQAQQHVTTQDHYVLTAENKYEI